MVAFFKYQFVNFDRIISVVGEYDCTMYILIHWLDMQKLIEKEKDFFCKREMICNCPNIIYSFEFYKTIFNWQLSLISSN